MEAAQLAPSLDAICACLGALLGERSVRSPAGLERLWAGTVQPGRPLRLVVSRGGERLRLMEPSEEGPGEGGVAACSWACTLEHVRGARARDRLAAATTAAATA